MILLLKFNKPNKRQTCLGSLVDDQHGSVSPTKETKSSSSTLRCESLGILRKSPNTTDFFDLRGAYIIGLTGGIASGKSSICKHLQSHGAVIIDCDKLGHVAYEPGTTAFKKVVDCFGADVVSQEGSIDRKVLASRVFTSDSREKNLNLANLNAIVWPEIERHARRKIAEAVKNNRENKHKKLVCVLDAAVLLEVSQWHYKVVFLFERSYSMLELNFMGSSRALKHLVSVSTHGDKELFF